MKAHIVAVAPLALLYGIPKEHLAFELLQELGFKTRLITAQEISQPVGLLAGQSGKACRPNEEPAPQESLLVMSGFTNAQVNSALDAMRSAQVQIDYKAIITKHNKNWSMLALLEELKKERAAIERGKKNEL